MIGTQKGSDFWGALRRGSPFHIAQQRLQHSGHSPALVQDEDEGDHDVQGVNADDHDAEEDATNPFPLLLLLVGGAVGISSSSSSSSSEMEDGKAPNFFCCCCQCCCCCCFHVCVSVVEAVEVEEAAGCGRRRASCCRTEKVLLFLLFLLFLSFASKERKKADQKGQGWGQSRLEVCLEKGLSTIV